MHCWNLERVSPRARLVDKEAGVQFGIWAEQSGVISGQTLEDRRLRILQQPQLNCEPTWTLIELLTGIKNGPLSKYTHLHVSEPLSDLEYIKCKDAVADEVVEWEPKHLKAW